MMEYKPTPAMREKQIEFHLDKSKDARDVEFRHHIKRIVILRTKQNEERTTKLHVS